MYYFSQSINSGKGFSHLIPEGNSHSACIGGGGGVHNDMLCVVGAFVSVKMCVWSWCVCVVCVCVCEEGFFSFHQIPQGRCFIGH